MKFLTGPTFVFAILVLAPVSHLACQTQGHLANSVDSILSDYDRADSPGWAVLVVQDGEVALRRGYGMASLEHQHRGTEHLVELLDFLLILV